MKSSQVWLRSCSILGRIQIQAVKKTLFLSHLTAENNEHFLSLIFLL